MTAKALFSESIGQIFSLEPEEFNAFFEAFDVVEVVKKDKIVLFNRQENYEYVVVKGCLKSFVFDEKGREKILDFYLEGNWLMDGSACSLGELSSMEVEALEASVLLRMKVKDKEALIARYPKIDTFYQKKYYRDVVQSHARILSLLRNSTTEKYQQLLEQHPNLLQRVPKMLIAYYLGVSRETLGRLENSHVF